MLEKVWREQKAAGAFEKLCKKKSAVQQKPKNVFTRHSDNRENCCKRFGKIELVEQFPTEDRY